MTDTKKQQHTPIEVWLRQPNIEITCTVVREDESTRSVEVDSLSLRGAQREITGWLIGLGYEPVGRWEAEAVEGADADVGGPPVEYLPETRRYFKPKNVTDPV